MAQLTKSMKDSLKRQQLDVPMTIGPTAADVAKVVVEPKLIDDAKEIVRILSPIRAMSVIETETYEQALKCLANYFTPVFIVKACDTEPANCDPKFLVPNPK